MRIPVEIISRIAADHELDAFVKKCVSKTSAHINSNRMEFFPEYTDHAVTHLEAVLETCLSLATDGSLEVINQTDLGLLVVSVALHDLGMHLTKDGFRSLIQKDCRWQPIEGFGDKPWHDLWIDFLAEARRFNSKKLTSLLGENYRPITTFPSFADPWDEFDYLLVGEFLRRHHPRLAHEIAIYGLPGKDGATIEICELASSSQRFWADISGLIARSHGLSLRATFFYLENRYENRIDPRGTHPIYLMVLLRVADYLQIQSSRAPHERTETTTFKSPISTQEWRLHQCITDITNTRDPEALDIIAAPDNVDIFLRLQSWAQDLQRELDTSWAVLGEVYGLQAHNRLNSLGIKIRRVRSNLEDTDAFGRSVNFVPERIVFGTAGGDLLKLLVGPLYANETKVGVRELVQNATDAVKELEQLISEGAIDEPEDRWPIESDVEVKFLRDEKNEVTDIYVIDRGVGMSLPVVRDYFLKAGASLRSSDAWKKLHESADGSLKAQRTGRFGVGLLAAFLLGDKIEVTTRHHTSEPDGGLNLET